MNRVVSLLVGIFLVCLVPAASAQVEISGSLGSNSNYHIKVPASWNGDLVIWNHGFSLDDPLNGVPSLGPLEPLQLSEGYAIAASSYRVMGIAALLACGRPAADTHDDAGHLQRDCRRGAWSMPHRPELRDS